MWCKCQHLLFIRIFLPPVFLIHTFSRQPSFIKNAASCVIFTVTIVLAVPVLKHGLFILFNKFRSSLPPPDIPPRVWAVVLALYLNTINGLTGSGNWVVISNNVSLSVTHISCVPFLEYLTDSKYKNSGHCAVLEECKCKFDLQKFQHCVMKWYDWMAI